MRLVFLLKMWYYYGRGDIVEFNVRIDDDLNEELKMIAKKEGRSKNKQIEYILRKYVENYNENNTNININQSNSNKPKVNIKGK